MDFSKENYEAAEKADFAYSEWYSRLPDAGNHRLLPNWPSAFLSN